ncbi:MULTISPECIES: glutamate carboxypeptidase [Stenotrophomonas]|uniref:glutamate carboxypeptidase n=1 Tax=Stenotrophomonas TaxID=40323 RepID=UPI0008A1C819|nr:MULTISPECIES: glutamate carboxypeptidase [Stenotrophomonas]OFU89043.1 peptidase M20 [Stenotrophomonas sp. HMSC10F07]
MRNRLCLAPLLLLCCSPLLAAERHANPDKALRAAAQKEVSAVIATLDDLVNIESGSNDTQGLMQMSTYLASRLERLGATVDRPPATGEGVPMVRGVLKGTGALRIMLIAHMDTVYDRGILGSEPFRREGNLIYGPGIADDKGGIAVILHSLALLQARGWKDYAQVTVLLNPDEEIGSPGSGETIAALAAEQDVVLSFEPSPAKAVIKSEGVLLSAAGTSQVMMTVNGRASHAGAAPEQGRNALLELSNRLLQTRTVAEEVHGAHLNWTMAKAGAARNQIPAEASATGDVRVTEVGANERLLAALKEKTATPGLIPDTITTVSLDPLRPMYVAGERGAALADRARKIYAELDGRELLFHPTTNGGTDAGFAGKSGKAAVLEGLGLAGWGYHAKNEFIEVDSIEPRVYLVARMMMDLGADASAKR